MHHQHNQTLLNSNFLNLNNITSETVHLIDRSVSAKQRSDQFNYPSLNSFHLGSNKSDRGSTDAYRLNILNTRKESRTIIEKTSTVNGNLIPFKFNNISYQSLRPQSMTSAKHFMEYSFKNNQPTNMLQINTNSNKSASDSLKISNGTNVNNLNNTNGLANLPASIVNKKDSDRYSDSNFSANQHLQFNQNPNFVNPKIINDSNKFIENILAHSKRNLKPPPSLRVNNSDSRNQLQLLSASLNLPNNVITINRTNEEKFLFPDKLILERRNLNCCPIIEGDLQLKLINYQHNQIKTIHNLDQMSNLIFLDLYDNRIERINGLSSLVNLRVLMLGKNRISKIENLEHLVHLDVLDLHGNQISCIENLRSLHELRVLNIAANLLKKVENLDGLHSLVELNLRRNQIAEINDLEYCTKLQRLFLSFNEIVSLLRIKNLNQITNLQELTLDNNPLSAEKNYKRNLLAQLSALKKLDSKKVTEEEKRNAERMYCKSETKKRELENYYSLEEKRKTAIRDAKTDWLNQHQNNKYLDVAKLDRLSLVNSSVDHQTPENLQNRENTSDQLISNNNQLTKSPMDSNAQPNTGPLNLIQRQIVTSKPNTTGNTSYFNYQNYYQQYQHQLADNHGTNHNSSTNCNKINAKLKIVQMRNRHESLGSLNNTSFSNQNVNIISTTNNSSNNSLHEDPANEYKTTTLITFGADTSLNEFGNHHNSQSNEQNTTTTSDTALNTQQTNNRQSISLINRSTSAKPLGLIRNPNNLLSSIATSSSSSVNNVNNKRSITFNNGSNVYEETTMYFYGSKSMDILETKIDMSIINQVSIISFNYIDYDDNLSKNFSRIKNKFPNAMNLVFTCCNIKSLNQIDSLTDWKKLETLTINKDDNPIFLITIWNHYAIFRLANLQLKKLNDKLITLEDIAVANRYLNHYANLTLYLPEFKLLAILGQDKKKLIKLAKENLHDSTATPNNEQQNARDQLTKMVLASNFLTNSKFNGGNVLNADTDFFLADKKMNQSQTLLNGVITQMNYNEMKTHKINNKKPLIWRIIVEKNVKKLNKIDRHVADLCKKHKLQY